MKIIYNTILPFKYFLGRKFLAINIFGVLFVRKELKDKLTDIVINHESIHSEQIKETLFIPFYIFYILEWFIKLFKYGTNSYKNISFEREANVNEKNKDYIASRKHYSFIKYL